MKSGSRSSKQKWYRRVPTATKNTFSLLWLLWLLLACQTENHHPSPALPTSMTASATALSKELSNFITLQKTVIQRNERSQSTLVKTATAPTLFYSSDSTVSHYEKNSAKRQGLGQRLPEFFNTRVRIANYAKSGRAISTYKEEGYWQQLIEQVKPGDVVLIQFGINDRTDVPNKSDFKQFLRSYVAEVRNRNAIPVLVTPTPRNQHKNQLYTNAFLKYCQAKVEVAQELNVTLIDLQTRGLIFYSTLGVNRVSNEMMYDTLHLLDLGAYHMARLLAEAIFESQLSPLNRYVITDNLDPDTPPQSDGWSPQSGYTTF